VATNCNEDGVLSPPVEASELIGMAPGAETTILPETSGDLERTVLDQGVVSNGTSRKLALVETGVLTEATNERRLTGDDFPPVLENLGEAWSLVIGTVERALQAITGQCRMNEYIGLADGWTMNMANCSRARLYLQLFWRTGIGWLDEIVSLLTERWKNEVPIVPPPRGRGYRQRRETFGRRNGADADCEHGAAGATSVNDEKRTIVLRIKRRPAVTHDRVGNVEPTLGRVLRNCATPW
jgi:hypothetical protein